MMLGEVRTVLLGARGRGVDPARALADAGLVLTDDVRKQITRETILEMATLIRETPMEVWLKGNMTVAGFRDNLVGWLRDQAEEKK